MGLSKATSDSTPRCAIDPSSVHSILHLFHEAKGQVRKLRYKVRLELVKSVTRYESDLL